MNGVRYEPLMFMQFVMQRWVLLILLLFAMSFNYLVMNSLTISSSSNKKLARTQHAPSTV